ncbi:MAG: hypothetical protein P4L90_05385 [Rhodopila sp.]|nr:hypothetical protein [Rhodopila sp.]
MTDPAQDQPSGLLMEFILGLLAPLLMAGSITDMHLARLAAQEAVAAYKARGQGELMTIGQILAFALTALDNLRLSMAPDLSLSMKLKLRGNANALNRAARDNSETLERARRETSPLEPSLAEQAAMAIWDETETEPAETSGPAEIPAPEHEAEATPAVQPVTMPDAPASTDQQNRLHWSRAMRTEAARLQAGTEHVPPAQRKANLLWVDVLTGVANDLTQGRCPTAGVGMSKSELLRTTLMAGDPGFPGHLATGIRSSAAIARKHTQQTAKRI